MESFSVGQNRGIVPSENSTSAFNEANAHLDVDAVPTRGARSDLTLQFPQLRSAGNYAKAGLEPIAQGVALTRLA